jgi:hypothetical protein
MSARAAGDQPAQTLSERTLVEVVRGASDASEPTEALRELLRRRPRRAPLLAEVVADRARPAEMRAIAAVALGRQATPAAKDALIAAVRDQDPLVLRRVAEALGKVGDEQALAVLEMLEPPRGPVKRSVDFAKTLLAYRLGLDKHRLRRPPAKNELEVQRRRAQRLEAVRPRRQALERIMADAAQELPGIAVTEQSALRFACGGHEFVILLTKQLERQDGVDALARRPAVVGAVLERSPVEDHYFLSEYLLSDPGGRGSSGHLYGVRPNGAVAHVGEVKPEAGATFELRALNTRYSPPVAIEGNYDPAKKQLRFTQMLVHPDFERNQIQPATPTPLDFPVA